MTATTQLSRGFRNFRFTKATEAASSCGTRVRAASLHVPFTPTRPPAENTAEKQRVRQQMLARNWHDDAISPELGSFCQKSHLIAGLIDLS